MTGRVKVALWGVGAHARRSAIPAFRSAPGVLPIGVYSRDRNAREDAAAQLDARPYEDPTALLEDDSEAVYLALPPGLHIEAGLQIVRAGKHLWTEKPAIPALAKAEMLFEAAERNGVGIFEAFLFKYHRQFEILSRLVTTGRIGKLVSVASTFGIPHLALSDHRYSADLGGGALNDAGVYTIAFSLLFLNAEGTIRGASLLAEAGYTVDTRGSMLLNNGDGASALGSWAFGAAYRNEAILWGTEGIISVERPFSKPRDLVTEIRLWGSRDSDEVMKVAPDDQFVNMLEAFAASIRAGEYQSPTADCLRQARVVTGVARVARGTSFYTKEQNVAW